MTDEITQTIVVNVWLYNFTKGKSSIKFMKLSLKPWQDPGLACQYGRHNKGHGVPRKCPPRHGSLLLSDLGRRGHSSESSGRSDGKGICCDRQSEAGWRDHCLRWALSRQVLQREPIITLWYGVQSLPCIQNVTNISKPCQIRMYNSAVWLHLKDRISM